MTYSLANSNAALVSGSLADTLSAVWNSVRFCRSRFVSGVWLLSGIPGESFEPVMSRLFASGATYVSAGTVLADRRDWIAFKAPVALAAKLAELFQAPAGVPPLVVRKGRVLSGAAERSAIAKLSNQAIGTVAKALARVEVVHSEASSPEGLVKTAAVVLQRVRPLTLGQAFFNGRGGEAWILGSVARGCVVRCWSALPNPWQVVPVQRAERLRVTKALPPAGETGGSVIPNWLRKWLQG